MFKCLATLTGAVAILGAALLATGSAEAGASASAPSKYGSKGHLASVYQVRTNRQARSSDFGITEYSSSSARTRSHGHAYR
jgi:hypothetical protein